MTAGFVLVGGCSLRMGRDKAFLPWHSRHLIEHVASQVGSATGNVALIGDPGRYGSLGIECFPDLRLGLGPLAGIEAALESRRGELNLIVACDMPALEPTWLARLLREAETSEALCVASRETSGAIHPLCAVYRNSCLPKVHRTLDAGRLKLLDFLEEISAVTVETDQTIWNINTPEEWTAWQRRERSSTGERKGAGDAH